MSTAKSVVKKIVMIVLAIVVLAVLYTLFFKPKSATSPLVSTDSSALANAALPESDAATNEAFLNTLLHLRGITLDQTIFTSPAFTSLEDFTITLIQPPTHGRPNPFAPIGSEGSTSTTTDTISTLSAGIITESSAVLSGSLASSLTPSERWFEWGITAAPSTRTSSITGSSASFSTTLSGLAPNTTYYYKAAAKVGGVLYYGPVVSFKTAPASSD